MRGWSVSTLYNALVLLPPIIDLSAVGETGVEAVGRV